MSMEPDEPPNEAARLAALRDLEILDTEPEDAFDRITRLAAEVLDVPIALVSLVDEERQWFKSRVGLDAKGTPRKDAFCAWAIHGDEIMEVPDALEDERFHDNPLVVGEPKIRFYVAAPLTTEAGSLGTLCAIDRRARTLTEPQRRVLSGLAEIAVDAIEARRKALEASRRARLLSLAEEVAAVGHWRVDLRNSDLFWSDQVYRIHGLEPTDDPPTIEEAVAYYHKEDRARVNDSMERTIRDRMPFDFELRLQRSDGEMRMVHAIGYPELDAAGATVVGIFGVFQDVTDRRQLQERLSQAEKMASVGTLAAGIAHEINNPLSYVKANAQALDEEIALWSGSSPSARLRELADMVTEICEGTQRIQKIVGGLKAFSRSSPPARGVLELSRVVEMAARLCMNELRHRAQFSIQANQNEARVMADESQLVQVAVNLIVNACQAIKEGAADSNEITVVVGEADGRAYFDVCDTGSGMTDSVRRNAFTPFFTTKPQGVGTGLGLAICHGIVRSFAGDLEIETAPGEGTRVRVSFPVAVEAADGSGDLWEARTPAMHVQPFRVLVLDDDPPVARSIARLLRDYDVHVETDPHQALATIADGVHFDAVLCDLMMPTMSGLAFIQQLQTTHPSLASRVVIVTGGVLEEEVTAFCRKAKLQVLEKPLDAEVLRTAMHNLLVGTRPAPDDREPS